MLAFFQASPSLPWCVSGQLPTQYLQGFQRADPKTTPVPSQDPLATLSSSSHTFGVIGMVGRSPSVLCPVHGLVVLQLLGRLGVVSEARDDFCGIVLEGWPPLALHNTEGSMHKQADKTEGQRELHGARWRRALSSTGSSPQPRYSRLFKAPSASCQPIRMGWNRAGPMFPHPPPQGERGVLRVSPP